MGKVSGIPVLIGKGGWAENLCRWETGQRGDGNQGCEKEKGR